MFSLPIDEIGAIGFRERETKKVLEFMSVVAPVLGIPERKVDTLIDLCSGNGLTGFAFQFNHLVKKSLMVDVMKPPRFVRLEELFKKYGLKYEHQIGDITEETFGLEGFDKNNSLIVSVHPCSELGDRVIELGLKNNIPFALMPCCHRVKGQPYKLSNPPDPRLMLYDEPADYRDLVRQRYIEEKGWDCHWREISKEITEKNHVLIGVPK
jgi:hypothetical protein